MKNKQSVHKMSEKELYLQLLIANILAESVNLSTDAQKILKTIGAFFHWKVGELWAVDIDKNIIICVSHWLQSETLQEIMALDYELKVAIGEGIPGLIWKNKSPCWIGDIKTKLPESLSNQFIDKFGLTSCFGIPIIFKEDILGMLIFYGQSIPQPNQEFIQLFTAIGQQIGLFIKRRRIEDELLHLSQHDPLTGLANRIILEKKINTEISYAVNHNTKAVLLYIDLDNFKLINDGYGHEFGDIFLRHVAKRLSETVRETDTVARLGGDEFAILLANIKTSKDMLDLANLILHVTQKPYLINNKEYFSTLSIGISVYPDDAGNAEELFTNADKSMYLAKKNGKNNIQLSSKNNPLINNEASKLADEFKSALDRQEFVIYFQPIAAISTNKIVGYEALLNWRHPNGKLLKAEKIMLKLQEKNVLTSINKWFLAEICCLCQQDEVISHNLHIPVLQLTEELVILFSDAFQKSSINSTSFTLEIKENTLQDTKVNLMHIRSLKKIGINVAIDSYGIGISSINLLKNFMIDKLKIDKSYIAALPLDPIAKSIVSAIIAMAHALKMRTIAVGVENKAQLNLLKTLGCDEYQGNYFSKPLLLESALLHHKKHS